MVTTIPTDLRPGNRVDLVARIRKADVPERYRMADFPNLFPHISSEKHTHDRVAFPLLHHVEILNWTPEKGLTVALTPGEVELLFAMLGDFELAVSLRHPDDTNFAPHVRHTFRDQLKPRDAEPTERRPVEE